jgi:hypothetical protein
MAHGLVSTGVSFPDSTIQTTAAAITPVGAVMTCAPNAYTPTGWLDTEFAYSKTTYSALYSAIGNRYNSLMINAPFTWGSPIASMNNWVPQPVQYQGSKFASNGSGTFIMIGDAGRVSRSTDSGATWNTTVPINATDCFGVGYGNGRFVIAGVSKILYSTDNGASWTAGTMTAATGYNAVYGNGVWVMGCSAGIIQRSTDGINFTTAQDTGAQVHFAAAFGNGIFVVAGADGQVYSSTDGLSWTQRVADLSAGGGTTENINDMRYDSVNNRFYGCAENGIMLYCSGTDITSWTIVPITTSGAVATDDWQQCCYINPLGIYVYTDAASADTIWTPDFVSFYRAGSGFGTFGSNMPYTCINYDSASNVLLFNAYGDGGLDAYGGQILINGLYRNTNPVSIGFTGGPPLTHFWLSRNYANAGTYFSQSAKVIVKY